MKIAIIEDNPSVRRVLAGMLTSNFPDAEIVAVAGNVESGVNALLEHQPNLAFLDVEMPDGNAFDLLRQLPSMDTQLIFITAHEKYAIQAIKFSAMDFLLKPIDEDELIASYQKAQQSLNQRDISQKVEVLLQNLSAKGSSPEKLILYDKYGIQIVETKNIILMESGGSYTTFHVAGLKPIIISQGLKHYEKMLDSHTFFRCHQSYLINMNFLTRYDKKNGELLILKDGSQIPLAGRRRDQLLERLKNF